MVQDCPVCRIQVISVRGGPCPRCGIDLGPAPGERLPAPVRIEEGDRNPDICIRCGSAAGSRVLVRRRRHLEKRFPALVLLLLSLEWATIILHGWIFPWVLLVTVVALSLAVCLWRPLSLEVPLCDACSTKGAPEPERVDFRERRMTFLAHPAFAEAAGRTSLTKEGEETIP